MDYEVVIVGAGPAGSAAAYDLCVSGKRVLLLDKHEFPREKPCAGGLTPKTLKALRYSVASVIKNVCSQMIVGKGLRRKTLFNSRHPICAMTVRSQFDAFCLKKTIKRGASFHVVKTIERINETDRHVGIHADFGPIRTKYLIGADGVNSRVRQLTRTFKGIKKGFAIEGTLPMGRATIPKMALDFDESISGYGWVFPKDDHANVGLYSSVGAGRLSKQKLLDYVKTRLGDGNIERISGYPIGTGGWNYRPMHKRIVLAGDAAGMADPLLGEGIFNAVKSGQMAALAVEQGLSEDIGIGRVYNDLIAEIKKDLMVGHRTTQWFYRYPSTGYRAMTLPPIKHALTKGVAMGWTLSKIIRNCYQLPFIRGQVQGKGIANLKFDM
jgi:geranylgeranyl reductase family protein